jgi:hypothetical protein
MADRMTEGQFTDIQQRAERQPNADVLALIAEVKWLRFDREQIDTERAAAVDAYNEASRRVEQAEQLLLDTCALRVAEKQSADNAALRHQHFLRAAVERAEQAEGALLRVRKLHEHLIEDGDDGDGYHKIHLCGDCGTSWPCATIAALDPEEAR